MSEAKKKTYQLVQNPAENADVRVSSRQVIDDGEKQIVAPCQRDETGIIHHPISDKCLAHNMEACR